MVEVTAQVAPHAWHEGFVAWFMVPPNQAGKYPDNAGFVKGGQGPIGF